MRYIGLSVPGVPRGAHAGDCVVDPKAMRNDGSRYTTIHAAAWSGRVAAIDQLATVELVAALRAASTRDEVPESGRVAWAESVG